MGKRFDLRRCHSGKGNTGQVKPEYASIAAWLLESSEPWVTFLAVGVLMRDKSFS